MVYERIKAGINLYAVLKNLEDLVELDQHCKKLLAGKNLSIQFTVKNGPAAWIRFENETCHVGQGKMKRPGVKLWFTSPAHLNKMFDGKANPIPLKGLTKLGFLKNEFSEITSKLEYYLKSEEVKTPSEEYIKINTRFTLTVAAFALSEIGRYDRKAAISASQIQDGKIQLKVLPEGPSVYLTIEKSSISAFKGIAEKPDAVMEMKDYQTANDFLNGKSNPFKAIACGEVMIKGQTPMLDNLSHILDRVPHYIS
ncbi:SCP2 sterol-binding domain-containing protein [Prolixibacteraceae bacterium Z1-6]|uniref:SCP2 sterol-binding domain-containing protein n=1 Tax=Draconibacterium aestuarii TaxID=2998507 RepID=A0A9X3F638_9BACT|nr:SCP2 sterol-binding domain-containing protein [Prolixibacteraceae bacterium Z1-6]